MCTREDIDRYDATMRKVQVAMREALTPDEYDDLVLATQVGHDWYRAELLRSIQDDGHEAWLSDGEAVTHTAADDGD